MSEPEIEKRRKKRRRSLRAYVNMNEPINQQAASLIDQFPPDADDDEGPAAVGKRDFSQSTRRRLAARGQALPDGSYPIPDEDALRRAAILARTGHGDAEAAKKLIRRRARELGVSNPLESSEKSMFNHPDPYTGADSHAMSRTSAPITDGHASPSTGDHGVGQGRANFIAAHHPDLAQSNTSFDDVMARLRTVNGAGNGDRDIIYTPGEVALRMFDAAGQAGHYHGMQPVNPSPERLDYHQHRDSATPPTPGHSRVDPVSHAGAPDAMKASGRLAIMKAGQRRLA